MSDAAVSSSINVLATLLGYIGAEAGSEDLFERMLWPQRFWNGFSFTNAAQVALTMSMFGPLHKAALKALDRILRNGLLKGEYLGDMLGSPFFRDAALPCKVHGFETRENESVRNGIWVRAIAMMPTPPNRKFATGEECGLHPRFKLRCKTAVSSLTLVCARNSREKPPAVILSDAGSLRPRHVIAIICSEVITVLVGILAFALWKSWVSILWYCPLALKLLSASFALEREELVDNVHSSGNVSKISGGKKIETFVPTYGFILIEGLESAISQFFRHYGHPIRSRKREIIQITIIVLFGCLFPFGLVCSVLWMPTGLQYLWLGHQLFSTAAMYTYRFSGSHSLATTEEKMVQEFSRQIGTHDNESTIVGLGTTSGNILSATLHTTFYERYSDASAAVSKLISETKEFELKTQSGPISPPPEQA